MERTGAPLPTAGSGVPGVIPRAMTKKGVKIKIRQSWDCFIVPMNFLYWYYIFFVLNWPLVVETSKQIFTKHNLNHHNINTLRPRQNGHHFADDIFKYIFLNEDVRISVNISLKFAPMGQIKNISVMVRRLGDKPSSEEIIFSLLTMMTSSNGNIFRVAGHLCGEFTGPGEFPAQRPVTRSFDVFFDLRLNTRPSKQSWGWWFETISRPSWRHRNAHIHTNPRNHH